MFALKLTVTLTFDQISLDRKHTITMKGCQYTSNDLFFCTKSRWRWEPVDITVPPNICKTIHTSLNYLWTSLVR